MLLPAANTVFTQENDALSAASGQATELPTMIAALVLARGHRLRLLPGAALADQAHQPRAQPRARPRVAAARHQRDLARGRLPHGPLGPRRRHRARLGPRCRTWRSRASASSRSGATRCSTSSPAAATASFQTDFAATSKKVGPGPAACSATRPPRSRRAGTGAALVATGAAGRDRLVRGQQPGVQLLGSQANYAAERTWSSGQPGSTAAGYNALEARHRQRDPRRPGRLRVRRHRGSERARARWPGS